MTRGREEGTVDVEVCLREARDGLLGLNEGQFFRLAPWPLRACPEKLQALDLIFGLHPVALGERPCFSRASVPHLCSVYLGDQCSLRPLSSLETSSAWSQGELASPPGGSDWTPEAWSPGGKGLGWEWS